MNVTDVSYHVGALAYTELYRQLQSAIAEIERLQQFCVTQEQAHSAIVADLEKKLEVRHCG